MNKIKVFREKINQIEKPIRSKAFYQSFFVSFLLWLVLALMIINLYIFIDYLFLLSSLLCLVSAFAFVLKEIIYYRLLDFEKGEINYLLVTLRTIIFAVVISGFIIGITLWVSRLL